jgi:hypothetical protein
VGLVGGDVAFVAVGFVCGGVGSAWLSVHVCHVADSEWLELLVMVSSSSEHVTVEAATADRISSGCAVWSVWKFDALFEPVGASVFFGHASPDSIPFGVVGDIFPALVDDWAAVTDGFGTFHLGGVATVEEKQVGSAFASCPVFPSVEEVGMVGFVHS